MLIDQGHTLLIQNNPNPNVNVTQQQMVDYVAGVIRRERFRIAEIAKGALSAIPQIDQQVIDIAYNRSTNKSADDSIFEPSKLPNEH